MEGKPENIENLIKQVHLALNKEFGNKPFKVEDAVKVLKEKDLEFENVKELLTELKKRGLLEEEKNPQDSRNNVFHFIFAYESQVPTKDRLLKALKAAADYIRGGVDYKVLVVFLFYKALSDKWLSEVNKFRDEGYDITYAYMLANTNYYVLYDENENKLLTWHEATKNRETIIELANNITKISRLDEKLSDLQKVVDVLGLRGFINEDNLHTIESIINIFNSLDFSKIPYDVIGDAYMWILNYFAPQKAKEGENYTPQEVVKLLVTLLDIENNTTVLDPALGSGSMLIESWRYVSENNGKPKLMLYGQERNEIMGVIAKMNLILHDIMNYEIYIGDSLGNPRFQICDYVIANPPWDLDYNVNAIKEDPKVKKIYTTFVGDGFPSKSSMDWAWIQLMLYFAKRKVGVILDNGALFRGSVEKKIRQGIVQKDFIEAVVLLPEKLFYNTGAPGAVIIFNKNKPKERQEKIMFINASMEYEKNTDIQRLNRLGDENINKIVNVYRNFKNIEGFSRVVNLEEIKNNDYNLNVTLYVFPQEEKEEIDISREFFELKELEKEKQEIMGKLEQYLTEIIKANDEKDK